MRARDLVYQQLAEEFGVSPSYIPNYLERFTADAPIRQSIERMIAQAEVALREETAALTEVDLEDAAEAPDPKKELDNLSSDRAMRRLRGQYGAHRSWANTVDRTARTRPARDAFEARFEREVDPDGVLPPEERAKRAANARKAYFTALALKSVQSRRARKIASR